MEKSEAVVVTNHAVCEMVWVLRSRYGVSRSGVAATIRGLLDTRNVVLDASAMNAGLTTLEAGADFADGVIAHEGRWLGRGDLCLLRQESGRGRLRSKGCRPNCWRDRRGLLSATGTGHVRSGKSGVACNRPKWCRPSGCRSGVRGCGKTRNGHDKGEKPSLRA